jgi:hypothetical protein
MHKEDISQTHDCILQIEGKWEKGLRTGPGRIAFRASDVEREKELAGVMRDPLLITKKCAFDIAPPVPVLQPDSFPL